MLSNVQILQALQWGLNVDIDEQAHVLCALNADQSNYVDFVGGGIYFLTMTQPMVCTVRGETIR